MLSTMGLELINFINPELTWNTVSKGSRSASRRSRKLVIRSSKEGVELAGNCPKHVESEKVNVVLWFISALLCNCIAAFVFSP